MKKVILAAGLIGIAFASCKKNDDNGGSNNTSIIAKWNLNTIVSNYTTDGVDMGTDTSSMAGSYMEFKSDGKVYTLYVDSTFGNVYDTSSYKVNGSTLTVVDASNDTTNMQIMNLTGNAMELYDTYSETQGGSTTITKEWAFLTK